jgi:LacI family transcriptional regulator
VLPKVIVLIETSRAFGRGLLYGIASYAKIHGPWNFYREPRSLKQTVPSLTKWNANGIIMRNSNIYRQFLKLNLPVILILHDSTYPDKFPVVATDSKKIAKLAAEHLLARGLRHFAFCGLDDYFWSNDRKTDFINFITKSGYPIFVYEQSRYKKYKSWENEQMRMADWLKTLPKPVGIMACNDDRGQHVLEACKTAGLNVPEEVTVIGVDNDPLICELCDPPLTSIALNTESAGFHAAELLDRLMNGEPMDGQIIYAPPTHVVRRQSTDILAIDDLNLADAIRYIRQNAKRKIHVDDVVLQTSLSRRSLESRFRKILHRSIQEEIRRVRTELISEMLIETNLSISEISSAFNFTDLEHITRYFRKEKGLGLREFRKLNRKY